MLCLQNSTHLLNLILAMRSDSRIWLHVINSVGDRKLLLSPDTDVYNIGLPLIAKTNPESNSTHLKEATYSTRETTYHALTHDTNNYLSMIPELQIPSTMQTHYVCTGCDFISSFPGLQ